MIIQIIILLLPGCVSREAIKYGFPEETVPGKITRTDLGCYYLPSSYTPEKEYPLIVLLHGLGMQDGSFITAYDWLEQAEKREYVICAVRSRRINWRCS